MIGGGVLQLGW